MKKEPSGFVSAQFRYCILVCPFGYHSDVWVWYKPMSGAAQVWPLAAFSKLQAICSLWLIPPNLAELRLGQPALQSWILSALGPGGCQQLSQVATGYTSPSICLLASFQS